MAKGKTVQKKLKSLYNQLKKCIQQPLTRLSRHALKQDPPVEKMVTTLAGRITKKIETLKLTK